MEKVQETDIFQVAENFETFGKIETITPYGSGHINDTYLVVEKNGSSLNSRESLHWPENMPRCIAA